EQLLLDGQRKAGCLLAVAERRVEDADAVVCWLLHPVIRTPRQASSQTYSFYCLINRIYYGAVNLDDLRVFSAVAAERSFSKAAARVGRTQPAVSQAVRRLEEAVGARLVDRAQRDGSLTQAGTLLLDYAARMLELSDEARTSLNELD